MNEKTYPSDLTDEEWEWIKEVIPAAKSGGRPRTLCMRAVLNAIFYVTKGGIQWRMLPVYFPKWQETPVFHVEDLSEAPCAGPGRPGFLCRPDGDVPGTFRARDRKSVV